MDQFKPNGDGMNRLAFDLRPWAKANRYRWRFEESYQYERPEHRGDGRCYVEVICRYGLIYPKGGDTLLAYANRGSKRHIAELPGVEHHQWDDGAEVFRFPVELLDEVAGILKPRKRRMLHPDRARAISGLQTVHAQSMQTELETPQGW